MQHLLNKGEYHKKHSHEDDWKNKFDRFVLIVSIFGPVTTLPQIYDIFSTQSAVGVSALTWILYTTLCLIWLTYGVIHKLKPVIVSNTLWVTLQSLIIIGAVIY
ncbi:MAG: PQ-loop domain-containing transporter [Patescibacteria group bacterium]|nr:PQ-loop domain-containing transporter [Patescibacteria group bacterium]